MSKKVTFDGAPEPGTINFGVGQPSADLLPVELLRIAADDFLRSAKPVELNTVKDREIFAFWKRLQHS